MADNVLLPGTGTTVASKEVNGVEFQRVVLVNADANNDVTPATLESIVLLRRMVKLLEPLQIVDSSTRQRVAVDSMPVVSTTTNLTQLGGTNITVGNGISSAGVQRVYVSWDSLWDEKIALQRDNYNNGIRSKLTFS